MVNIGDIVFIRNKSLISKAIRWWTTSKWSHCAIIVNYDREIIEATIPRVRKVNLSVYKGLEYAILTPMVLLTDEEKSLMLKILAENIGTLYDWKGILSFIIKSNVGNKTFNFCSEKIIETYRKLGRILLRKETQWTTPQDLYESLELQIIEEGVL